MAVIGNAAKYNPCASYLDEPQVPEELTKLDE
ncbi:cyclic lactone autoinducer peptide [Staphylococcus epidermidis]|nr:cyclic lactone autoinducer peptide [Staphylococcus epidermidis]